MYDLYGKVPLNRGVNVSEIIGARHIQYRRIIVAICHDIIKPFEPVRDG
jgi:hypothetical protein